MLRLARILCGTYVPSKRRFDKYGLRQFYWGFPKVLYTSLHQEIHPNFQSRPIPHIAPHVLHSSEMVSFIPKSCLLWQVSIAAFLILIDYFSSIPVTKKNLVTQQTQLLVTFMTFFVCLQASDLTQCFPNVCIGKLSPYLFQQANRKYMIKW